MKYSLGVIVMSDDDEGGTANVAKTAAPMVDKVVATLVSDFMLK